MSQTTTLSQVMERVENMSRNPYGHEYKNKGYIALIISIPLKSEANLIH